MKNSKFPTFLLCAALAGSISLMVGCNTSKPGGLFSEVDAKPPTATELRLFKALTNYEDRVTLRTNEVLQTNAQGAVTSVATVVQETNRVPVVQLSPGTGSNTISTLITGLAGFFGWGGLAGAGLTGITKTYLDRRNQALAGAKISALKNVSGVFAQQIETLRQVIATTPQGQQLGLAVKHYLMEHQNTEGVIQQATEIVGTAVDTTEAKESADEIRALLKDLSPAPTATVIVGGPTANA